MTDLTFGEWLKRRRGALGLTQEQLAQQIGCSTIALRKIEAEERRPSLQIAERLADVLGVETRDRSAFLRFARGDWQAAPTTSRAATPWQTTHSNLPAPLTSFIGREADVAAVRNYLLAPATRLVTLIGPPGIGKTRLSLQVAHDLLPDFADGVSFVPLAPVEDPDLVAPTLVQTLGLMQTDQRSALDCLKSGINQRQMLIVLDNFEQVIEAAALTAELLRACPNLKIIVTSRESLRVPGEWLYPVPPLTLPDEIQLKALTLEGTDRFSALHLFAERARAVRSGFALTRENMATVATICRQLDGLPLAIELIASRIRLMSPQELAARLTSDFKLHADGMRGVPPRQKTLHNAIVWSYDLLSRDEQVLLARSAVFAGGFTLDAAQAVLELPDVINGVMSLLDKSLFVRAIDAQGAARFNLLEMIRDFALDRLRERGEEAATRDRHAAYFLEVAEEADRAWHGPQQTARLNRLEMDHSNLLTALAWLLDCQETSLEEGLRLAGALWKFWSIRGYWAEGLHWISRALTTGGDSFGSLRARLLVASGHLLIRRGLVEQAKEYLQKSLVIYESVGDKRGAGGALEWLGTVAEAQEDNSQAIALYEQSLALIRQLDRKPGIASLLVRLGFMALQQGDIDRAARLFEESLSLSETMGDKMSSSFALRHLGMVALARTNLAQAATFFHRSLALAQELNAKSAIAHVLIDLGELARVQDNYTEAAAFYEESLELSQELGAVSVVRDLIHNLGYVALHQANNRQARILFEQALTQYHEARNKVGVTHCLRGLAAVASTNAEFEKAARLFGAADGLLEIDDMSFSSADQAEYHRYSRQVLSQLDATQFEALQAEGRAMTLEQAIELALSDRL